jgi:hypothetical protein
MGKDFPISLAHNFCFSSELVSHLVEFIPYVRRLFRLPPDSLVNKKIIIQFKFIRYVEHLIFYEYIY